MSARNRLTAMLSRLPGIGSYRGRYLYFALAVVLTFAVAGTVGYLQVSGVSQQHLANIQQRAQATAALQDALALLREAQNRIGRYLINPPQDTPTSIRATNQRLHTAVHHLASADWIRSTPEMLLLVESIDESLAELDELAEQLITLRSSHNLWLPATVEIENGIHPATVAGLGLLDEIRQELLLAENTPRTMEQLAVVNTMQQRWIQSLAEVRLVLINRFGVFTADSEQGMAAREQNVRTYLDSFRANLGMLEEMRAAGTLGLVAEARVGELADVANRWEDAVSIAMLQLTDRDWRPDMTLVRDQIEPLIDTLQQRLSSLRLELDVESARNITELTQVSRGLTQFAALLIAAGAAFALGAYLMFDRMLLRPIQQTTLALKQEARGEGKLPSSTGKAQEIRDLVTAYEAMRRQVRQRQDHLDHIAHHDNLSGLPNRLLFRDRLEHALAFARREGTMHAVMILDLDGFKKINDTLGHAAGDALLCTAADRLTDTVRQSDTVARLGGDEFAILIERLEHRNDLTRLAEKILASLELPFEVEGRLLHLSTSIGIAVAPHDGIDPDTLTRAADTAMYAAKQAGKACFRFFTAAMSQQANDYMELETQLRSAVENQAFELHFQPIITASDNRLHGCEALLRWRHPDGKHVSPAQFVPVLEDMGKLGHVSRWILAQLGEQQQRCKQGATPLTVSMNLTARLLCDPAFSNFLLTNLREHVAMASSLVIEITEDSLSEDLDAAARVMQEMKALGVRIALDDFGTGQSSLAHLRHFPFDLVKIDREFVRDIPHDPNDVSLVQAIIELSHAFEMKVVAEGVETEQQAALLKQLGCDYLQGYLISRPVPAEELSRFLADHPDITRQAASRRA